MRLSFAIGVRFFYTFALVLLILSAGFARERGPGLSIAAGAGNPRREANTGVRVTRHQLRRSAVDVEAARSFRRHKQEPAAEGHFGRRAVCNHDRGGGHERNERLADN